VKPLPPDIDYLFSNNLLLGFDSTTTKRGPTDSFLSSREKQNGIIEF
jgi:hypothetical protein